MCHFNPEHDEKRKADGQPTKHKPVATLLSRDGDVLARIPVWPVIGFLSFVIWWLPNPLMIAVIIVGVGLMLGWRISFGKDDGHKIKRKLKNDDPYYEF